jgi:hypothetical protein
MHRYIQTRIGCFRQVEQKKGYDIMTMLKTPMPTTKTSSSAVLLASLIFLILATIGLGFDFWNYFAAIIARSPLLLPIRMVNIIKWVSAILAGTATVGIFFVQWRHAEEYRAQKEPLDGAKNTKDRTGDAENAVECTYARVLRS